jgi:GH43 family beta-xylosidase
MFQKGSITMTNFIEAIRGKTHELILEANEVLDTLCVINNHQRWYINQKLAVGNCEMEEGDTKWYIYFNATSWQWKSIINDLTEKGFVLEIRDSTKRIHLIRKV